MPEKGQKQMLDELHEGHPGIARMKSLARTLIWWPKLDSVIEARVKPMSYLSKE